MTLILCIGLIQTLHSQTADEIINKHIEAIGGYEKIKAIKTMIYEGITRTYGADKRFQGYLVQDSAIHIEYIDSNGYSGYTIVTKSDGWTFDARTNTMTKMSKKEVKDLQYLLEANGPLFDYKNRKGKAKYLGKETIDGKEYFKVRLVKHNKDRLSYYFDSSYFIFRINYEPTGIYGPIRTTEYSYQSIDGGYFFVYKLINRESQMERIYTSIILNPEIDRSLFLPHNVNKKEQYH